MNEKIGVYAVDPFPVVRMGVRTMMSGLDDLRFAGEAESVESLDERMQAVNATVLITELDVPDETALIDALDRARTRFAELVAIVHSRLTDARDRARVLAGRIQGLVPQNEPTIVLLETIRRAVGGRVDATPHLSPVTPLMTAPADAMKTEVRLLSARETEVVRLLATGLSVKETAKALGRSPKTIDAHKARIFSKLGVQDRVGITRWAIRVGLVEP